MIRISAGASQLSASVSPTETTRGVVERGTLSELIVVDYDPHWPRLFETLRSSIWSAVADIVISIEHVGSTAVPGLAAKPVIDIDVVVPEEAVAVGIVRLTALGYQHRGDHGVPKREAFRSPNGSPRHHLYLCPSSSPALAYHLAIRDYLRTHPSDARAYGELKKRLALEFAHDSIGYVEAKTRFLVAILRQIGFSDDRLAEIIRINRRPEAG
jgi:GrpB-like predicted nucleotidyltransferase (UPF0157 family)